MASEPKVGDVRNMSSAKDTAEVFAGREIGWVFCNLKGACRLLASLIGREREAAREMREVLRGLEWSGIINDYDYCPICNGNAPNHAPDCRLARLIGGGE